MAAKKNMTSADIESERDAEIYLRQSAKKYALTEIQIELDVNPDFEDDEVRKWIYTITVKREDDEEKETRKASDDPDNAYQEAIKETIKKIAARAVVGS